MKYSIGDYVVVLYKMQRRSSSGIKWVPQKLNSPRLGQVVGLAVRHDGKMECPLNYEEGAYFISENTHVFWQVKFGLMNKPIYVRTCDMRLATIDEVEDLPKMCVHNYWTDAMRRAMSEDSKNWGRDSKGRWTSV
jgi:hypothetical protein